MTGQWNRRACLRGLGLGLALPSLESLCRAATGRADATPAPATTATAMPLRMVFIAFPNGSNYERWLPRGEGKDYQLNETLIPLEGLRNKFQIITNLAHEMAKDLGDGTGDHARSAAAFLTGCHAWKTQGAKLKLGISVDQIAARQVGHLTRLDSLQLGTETSRLYGSCDTGYPCAYQYNLSWASETMPLGPESNPRVVFERLFGSGPAATRAESLKIRQTERKSVLDFVRQEARAMHSRLGVSDRHKMDDYLGGVRAIEVQIEKAERFALPGATTDAPGGAPDDHGAHLQLMYDLLTVALQTDSTRIVSFPVAPEASNRPFPELGIAEGHHFLTHHMGNPDKRQKAARIERWYTERFAGFLRGLDAIKEADGHSLLDNSMVVYGCAIGDGNKHNHDQLPVILAGGGGGTLTGGRHLKLPQATPMSNLFLSMLDRMGVAAERIGDSSGRLAGV